MIGIYQNGKAGEATNLPRKEVEKLARSTYQKGVFVFKLIMNTGEVKTAKIVKE